MKKIDFFKKIVGIIGVSEGVSKKDLAKELDFTAAGVTKSMRELLDSKLIEEKKIGNSTGGRKPVIYGINAEKIGDILGINLAPQKIEILTSNIYGENLEKRELVMSRPKDMLEQLSNEIQKELDKNKKISIISLVLNGLVDSKNGISIFSPHYKWKNINLKKYFEDKFGIPVVLENDVRAMALVEKIFGKCKKTKEFVVLNISEGIGAGIYLKDDIYSGNKFIAGEIGHITVNRDSVRKCSCGKYGCLEAEVKYLMEQITDSNREEVLSKISEKIAIGVDILISIINPEKIILVGNVVKDKIFKKKLSENVLQVTLLEQKCEIVISDFQDDMGAYSTIALVCYKLYSDDKLLKKFLKNK